MLKLIIIFLLSLISSECFGQSEKLQPIGSISTYMVNCPCKLFKYYDGKGVYYFCRDKANNIDYTIREFKHKDRIDVFINNIKNTVSRNEVHDEKSYYMEEYLNSNSTNSSIVNVLDGKGVLVNNINEKKLFFSANDLSVSYEIQLSGNNSELVSLNFTKCVNSLLSKKNNFKTFF